MELMKTVSSEFSPLELERAEELQETINRAAREGQAILIESEEEGVSGLERPELISPEENVNGLVRYQRHYASRKKT
jgi:hypothetical protein